MDSGTSQHGGLNSKISRVCINAFVMSFTSCRPQQVASSMCMQERRGQDMLSRHVGKEKEHIRSKKQAYNRVLSTDLV